MGHEAQPDDDSEFEEECEHSACEPFCEPAPSAWVRVPHIGLSLGSSAECSAASLETVVIAVSLSPG